VNISNLYKAANTFLKLCQIHPLEDLFAGFRVCRITKTDIQNNEIDEWYNTNKHIVDRFIKYFQYIFYINVSNDKWGIIFDIKYDHSKNEQETLLITDIKVDKNYIYNSDKFSPEKSTIIDSYFLRGTKNIPDLYFTLIINKEESQAEDVLDKSYLQYSYLIPVIQDFNYYKNKSTSLMAFENFVIDNKSKLDEISKMFSYNPRLIGSGEDGFAYSISDRMVLKIFKQENPYNAAKKSMEYMYTHPDIAKTEAMYYDVGKLKLDNETIYYYIMEKMIPFYGSDLDINLKGEAIDL